MAITVQALQDDGTWAVRNAFKTENAKVISGAMKASELEADARRVMGQWSSAMPDGRQLRVHNSDKDPKVEPAPRKRNPVTYQRDTATGNFGNPDNYARAGVIEALGGLLADPRGEDLS